MDAIRGTTDELARDRSGLVVAQSVFARIGNVHSNDHELSLIEDAKHRLVALPEREGSRFSRLLDIVLSLALLVLLAPAMLVVGLLLMISGPEQVIFRQQRVGKGGKLFGCLKFRTMRSDADKVLAELLDARPDIKREWANTHKLESDPRVTRLGKFLRVTSLDELPQLLNVLLGEMSLVGPRPIVAEELACYGRYSGHYLSVRPGLTGMWQISGRSLTTYRRRVAADLLYVRRKSIGLDIWIMLATIPAVIFARGSI